MKDSDWEILYELHKNPNVTKVAKLLYITQPSLTKRIQHIEGEFQVQILDRTPHGIRFTKEGEYLAERARIYMEFQKETKRGVEEFKKAETPEINIGSAYTYSKYALMDILAGYVKAHPKVMLNITNDQSNILLRRVLEGAVDVGFIRGDYDAEVNKVLVAKDEAYLITKEPVALSELLNMPRIGYKTNDKTRELLDGWWERQFQTEAPVGMSVGYMDFAWQLISKDRGYTLCFLPEDFKNENNLCLTPLRNPDGTKVVRNTWFIYDKNKRKDRTLENFIQYIEETAALR